ncbi:JAB domain-containing protein [Bombilactobacillus folatiphilus]|uniref:JAB domain-containing protein n=1 Tax=Bombilactobacillus folatiphilus TaxID=2923362 RepID=A0ABY4PAM0_9LACO|nr:JAB domain-containing protein [Bombilactobacillus folatiphilus]UQS82691.1 JAB domain-containing protein [Bombilactobacillus folatiphilus]
MQKKTNDNWLPQNLTISQLLMLILDQTLAEDVRLTIVQQLAAYSAGFTDLLKLRQLSRGQITYLSFEDLRRLQAILEISTRLNYQNQLSVGQIFSTQQLGKHLIKKWCQTDHEELLGFFFDAQRQLLCEQVIFMGSLDQALVHPREIMQIALNLPCKYFVVAHNHPSGNLTPSNADITFTQRLATCGHCLEIELVDHLIIGKNNFSSFRQLELL